MNELREWSQIVSTGLQFERFASFDDFALFAIQGTIADEHNSSLS